MADKQCPLCGNLMDGDESVCPECNRSAHDRDSIHFLAEENIGDDPESSDEEVVNSDKSEENKQITSSYSVDKQLQEGKKKPKKKLFLFLFTILILCLALGGSIFWLHKEQKEKDDAELRFWYLCIEKNTPQVYSNYLEVYPKGKFVQDAQEKIGELRNAEYNEWEKLKKSSDLNDYYTFLSAYPQTPFKGQIQTIMDSLSWRIASKENTADSYLAYIQNADLNNITGYYKDVARTKYDYLSKIKKLEGEALDSVKQTLTVYFNALSDSQFKKIPDLFRSPDVKSFYGAKNLSPAMIVKSIQNDISKDKIKKQTYEPDFSSIKVLRDGNGICFIELKVTKKFTYKTKKKPDSASEKLYIELTPENKIRYLDTRKGDPDF